MSKNILIVGGAGYIGSYVNKLLDQSGYKTVILDNLSTGDRESVKYGTFIRGDLGDKEVLQRVFSHNSIDAVMHFAAFIDVGESVRHPAKYYHNNVANTLTLLNTMLEFGVEIFVFSSTAAIFGIPTAFVINENAPKNPINPYGETKLIVEHVLRDYSHAYNLRFCSLRYFNAAGGDPDNKILNNRTNQSNLIPRALRSLMNPEESLKIFGTDYDTPDGTCLRDYIHIHDLGTAHILAMEQLFQGAQSCCYNLGYGKGFSVLEVIASIERATKRRLNVVHAKRREGDPPKLIADSTKAQKELGWTPIYNDLDIITQHAWNTMRHQEAYCKLSH